MQGFERTTDDALRVELRSLLAEFRRMRAKDISSKIVYVDHFAARIDQGNTGRYPIQRGANPCVLDPRGVFRQGASMIPFGSCAIRLGACLEILLHLGDSRKKTGRVARA